MNKLKRTLVFTATYNERKNISELIKLIKTLDKNLDILIIDDNSPDQTSMEIQQNQKIFENIFLINRKEKLGLDSAHRIGYEYAKKNNYDFFISMDADLSHDPAEIKNFLNLLDEYPFVIGSRYIENGKCFMKGHRLFLSKYGNKFIKFLLKINCNEFTTSFRGFNMKSLTNANFDLNEINNKGYSFFMSTIYEINKRGIPIKEIPIIFRDRSKGESKIPKLELLRTFKNVITFFLKDFFKL